MVSSFVFIVFFNQQAYAEVNKTVSSGVRLFDILPPIVPRIPEIDLINVIFKDNHYSIFSSLNFLSYSELKKNLYNGSIVLILNCNGSVGESET